MKEQTSVQELIKKNNNNKGKVFADKKEITSGSYIKRIVKCC